MKDATMQALWMTAIRKHELRQTPMPSLDGRPEWALLRVRSVGVCGSDLHGYLGHTGRRVPPLIMGHEATAEVMEIGPQAAGVKPGDRVALHPIFDLGRHGQEKDRLVLGMNALGAFAEYLAWPAANLYRLSDSLSFEDGALAEPLAICIHAVGLAHIRPYDTAFIVGAGPIGLLTLAVLRSTAAGTIAVSDTSDARLERAKQLGAGVLINPLRQNSRAVVNDFTDGLGVDIAFEAVGASAACQQTIEATRDRGQVIWIGNNAKMVEVDMQLIVTHELRLFGSYGMTTQDFRRSLQMLADGAILTELIINRRAGLSQGETLFEELLAAPEIVKCVINFP